MQTSAYQANRQQLLMMGSTIFVSVTAAVIVSTLLIMSLMRGEIASALTSNVQTSSPVSQVASSCTVPKEDQSYSESTAPVTPVEGDMMSAPLMTASYHYVKPAPTSVNNSYNNTNTSTVTTTNNITNTELHKTTIIKDSFNEDSYNDNSKGSHNPVIIKDNTVNIDSNNVKNINSNNDVDLTKVTNNITNTVNSHSNNTTNSNNTLENHLLSDNTVIVPIVPIIPVLPTI